MGLQPPLVVITTANISDIRLCNQDSALLVIPLDNQ